MCCTKGTSQGNQDKEGRSRKKVQRENKKRDSQNPKKIPPGSMEVSLVNYVCCDGPITRPGESECECVNVCDLEISRMRRPSPELGCCAGGKTLYIYNVQSAPMTCRHLACVGYTRVGVQKYLRRV